MQPLEVQFALVKRRLQEAGNRGGGSHEVFHMESVDAIGELRETCENVVTPSDQVGWVVVDCQRVLRHLSQEFPDFSEWIPPGLDGDADADAVSFIGHLFHGVKK